VARHAAPLPVSSSFSGAKHDYQSPIVYIAHNQVRGIIQEDPYALRNRSGS